MTTHVILPAAGLATRMRGLPKFALPISDTYETLLERHISLALEVAETVWVPTRPENVALVNNLVNDERVVVIGMNTATMSETVLRTVALSGADRYMLGMPDTYMSANSPYLALADSTAPLTLAAWHVRPSQAGKLGQLDVDSDGHLIGVVDKDPECALELAWGAMAFDRRFLELVDAATPHLGYAIPHMMTNASVPVVTMAGQYYDCGTPAEYFELLTILTGSRA